MVFMIPNDKAMRMMIRMIDVHDENGEDDDDDEFCTSKQDLIDAVSVSEKIGIDIEVVNFAKEYKEKVFSLFISGLEKGITPNPDILCNSEIKFEAFQQGVDNRVYFALRESDINAATLSLVRKV